jgi:hypothetical protein
LMAGGAGLDFLTTYCMPGFRLLCQSGEWLEFIKCSNGPTSGGLIRLNIKRYFRPIIGYSANSLTFVPKISISRPKYCF